MHNCARCNWVFNGTEFFCPRCGLPGARVETGFPVEAVVYDAPRVLRLRNPGQVRAPFFLSDVAPFRLSQSQGEVPPGGEVIIEITCDQPGVTRDLFLDTRPFDVLRVYKLHASPPLRWPIAMAIPRLIPAQGNTKWEVSASSGHFIAKTAFLRPIDAVGQNTTYPLTLSQTRGPVQLLQTTLSVDKLPPAFSDGREVSLILVDEFEEEREVSRAVLQRRSIDIRISLEDRPFFFSPERPAEFEVQLRSVGNTQGLLRTDYPLFTAEDPFELAGVTLKPAGGPLRELDALDTQYLPVECAGKRIDDGSEPAEDEPVLVSLRLRTHPRTPDPPNEGEKAGVLSAKLQFHFQLIDSAQSHDFFEALLDVRPRPYTNEADRPLLVDLGTTNTMVAWAAYNRLPFELVSFSDSTVETEYYFKSAYHVLSWEPERLEYGLLALQGTPSAIDRSAKQRMSEADRKLYLRDAHNHELRKVEGEEGVARLIDKIIDQAARQIGKIPKRVRCSVPVHFTDEVRDRFRRAWDSRGVRADIARTEPQAYLLSRLSADIPLPLPPQAKRIEGYVLDMGGGTVDVAFFRLQTSKTGKIRNLTWLGQAGYPRAGGEAFTHFLCRRLAECGPLHVLTDGAISEVEDALLRPLWEQPETSRSGEPRWNERNSHMRDVYNQLHAVTEQAKAHRDPFAGFNFDGCTSKNPSHASPQTWYQAQTNLFFRDLFADILERARLLMEFRVLDQIDLVLLAGNGAKAFRSIIGDQLREWLGGNEQLQIDFQPEICKSGVVRGLESRDSEWDEDETRRTPLWWFLRENNDFVLACPAGARADQRELPLEDLPVLLEDLKNRPFEVWVSEEIAAERLKHDDPRFAKLWRYATFSRTPHARLDGVRFRLLDGKPVLYLTPEDEDEAIEVRPDDSEVR